MYVFKTLFLTRNIERQWHVETNVRREFVRKTTEV